ncbi:FGGY-family carbohydrate kinase [Prauserella rugosa]|uniref:Sugar (Pentulose or hexulose) kinase n=1 Tax=Prauserella rugosa TaxID=43354 RepID=A0A660C727_9PSEU|nr:FGGY family carbohydrate kinase [Prauserella rugosa]TWH19328.1 sugar (pentulose or hexulose) kinase [Prauserella rugosa]
MTVVGIDVATAGVRASAVADDGTVVARASAPLPAPVRTAGGRSEQDARAWWPAVESALWQVCAAPEVGTVDAVAVAATSGTIVAVDRHGTPVSPALMYDDRRAARENATAATVGADRWDAMGTAVTPTMALGRIAWLAREYPDAAGVAHTPDVIGTALLGEPVPVDWSHALKSGYDPGVRTWPWEVFDALGVPPSWLPGVVAPTCVLGETPRPVAGLPKGCRVVAGMTDGCAAQIATGAVSPGRFAGILGTTYVLKGVTRHRLVDPAGAVYSHRHPDGWWLAGGASNTGGAGVTGDLRRLDAAAAARGPAGMVAYPLTGTGERFPFSAGDARGFVLGEPSDEVELHRARLEGVAFLERLALETMRSLGATVEGPLLAAGGGSASALWNRIRATVTGLSLQVAEHAETAYGAALLAAAGTAPGGLDHLVARAATRGTVVDPEQAEAEALEASYLRFVGELGRRGWLDRVPMVER